MALLTVNDALDLAEMLTPTEISALSFAYKNLGKDFNYSSFGRAWYKSIGREFDSSKHAGNVRRFLLGLERKGLIYLLKSKPDKSFLFYIARPTDARILENIIRTSRNKERG